MLELELPRVPGKYTFGLTVSECRACSGYGIITHPEWVEFERANLKALKENAGFVDDLAADWFGSPYPEDWPPEEVLCGDCGGEGKVFSYSGWIKQ